jgi:hypothetical protein
MGGLLKMDSKELREDIRNEIVNASIFCPYERIVEANELADRIMSLLSENCWPKDTVTGVGEKKFEVVKPIEVDR